MRLTYTIGALLFVLTANTFAAPLTLENAGGLNKRIDELEIPWISTSNNNAEPEPRQRHNTVEGSRPSIDIDKRAPKFGLWASPKEEAMFADKKAPASAALAARDPARR